MQQRDKKGEKNKIGAIGEETAKNYLVNKGYSFVTSNYLKPWGEIDLVMKKGNVVYFVEVKTTSYDNLEQLQHSVSSGNWRPEENVNLSKMTKFKRVIETWIEENDWEGDFQIDVIAVRVVFNIKFASVKHIDNVIIDT